MKYASFYRAFNKRFVEGWIMKASISQIELINMNNF